MKLQIWLALSVALVGINCAGDDPGGGAGSAATSGTGGMGAGPAAASGAPTVRPGPALPDGQVVAPWDNYCVATFTKAFDVLDSFDKLKLSIRPGSRYLLGKPGFFDEANVIYIADAGPAVMEIDVGDSSVLPFTSSCDQGAGRTYIAVFVDTPIYSDAALTLPICTLPAGLAVPGDGINYVLDGSGAASSLTYKVDLKQLSPHCNAAAQGFAAAARVTIGNFSSNALPIATVLGPRSIEAR